jgi:hypothetical protein
MSIRHRTVTVLTGAAVTTALAGAAAFAAVGTQPAPATMDGLHEHMEGLDAPVVSQMHTSVAEGFSVGEMHR